MSMILDALTRAEHERQLEKQPDLKFVNPVKPQKNNPKKVWLWVALGLLANILIIFLVIQAITSDDAGIKMAETDEPEIVQEAVQEIATLYPAVTAQIEPQQEQVNQLAKIDEIKQQASSLDLATPNQLIDSRPLAMEAGSAQTPELDRPLIYESKQADVKPKSSVPQKATTQQPATGVKKGKVSFSSTELSADDAAPIIEKPKLLIDQGESVALNTQSSSSSSNVPDLRDLPESSRNSLNQYEVNVHVFDDDPIRRFVLINMDKYKEGDRIANNGPLVEEITSDGVVVDYGNGRALLPPK